MTLLGCLNDPQEFDAQAENKTAEVAVADPETKEEADSMPEATPIAPANLSVEIADVVRLAQSGVGEDVIVAYIERSGRKFNPSVDEIVYLKDVGIADSVLTALVQQQNVENEMTQAATPPEATDVQSGLREAQLNQVGESLAPAEAPSYSVNAQPEFAETGAAPPPQEININYFENTLSPYGSWVEVADYGRCWQPTVVIINRDWRPYCDRGRWIYTSHGWYWQSDYSWGWAAFHYGRWHCDSRIGWVWVPGTTWGPAWVSWRYTDQYCGWAPLPPSARYTGVGFSYNNSRVGINFEFGLRDDCYTFIPTSRFCERTPSRYYVSGSHSKVIYQNSVVINNYIRGNNNTIINEGIGRERISRATQKPVETVSLRYLPTTTSPAGRTERLEKNSLTVFKPTVSEPVNAATSTQSPVKPSTGRSQIATSVSARHNSLTENTTPGRSIKSITRTETVAQPAPASQPRTTPAPTTSPAPIGQTRPSFTRNLSPSSTERELHSPTRQQSPITAVTTLNSQNGATEKTHTPPGVATRPNASSSSLRNLPAQSSASQNSRTIEHRTGTIAPTATSRSPQQNIPSVSTQSPVTRGTQIAPSVPAQIPTTRETQIASPTFSRTEPATSPISRSQSNWREIRREEPVPQQNFGSVQRSFQQAAPAPTPYVQERTQPTYSAPSEPSQSANRRERERPAPQAGQPSYSPPQQSVSQSASREQSATASRERVDRISRGRNN